MDSKQRSKLKSFAVNINPVFQIGKDGVTENVIKQVKDALKAREIIKITLLETAESDIREVAAELAEKSQSEVVQTIGRKIILYKENKENPVVSGSLK